MKWIVIGIIGTALLAFLKLLKVITIDWIWVFSPLIAVYIGFIIVFLVIMIFRKG